jgi:zinc transport system substrate-binding protein
MNMKYIVAVVGIIIIGIVGLRLLGEQRALTDTSNVPGDTIDVIASFYPVYYFASEIGGDRANVQNITPAGAEPHDFVPNPQDLVAMQNADLLIFNGSGLEPWSESILADLSGEVTVVLASEGLATLEGEEHGHGHEEVEGEQHDEEEEHEEEADHDEDEHVVDPHVWLSPVLAQRMVDSIAEGFAQADPVNAAYYRDNATALKERLAELDTAYRQGLAECASDDVVVSHAAFAYLAAAYDLNQVSIAGLSPDEEPSAGELADIATFAREHDVRYIFFESLVSPKLSETIATEVGAETLVLDPIEGITRDDLAAGLDYVSLMERNLANLKTALRCTS